MKITRWSEMSVYMKRKQNSTHLNVNNIHWLDDVKESRIILFLVRFHHPAISVA